MIFNDAQKIYIGDNEVNKVYIQDTLIYTSTAPLTAFYIFRLGVNVNNGTTFSLPLLSSETYNFLVGWGNGEVTQVNNLSNVTKYTYEYNQQGIYFIDISAIKIQGFPGLNFGGYTTVDQDIVNARNSLFYVDLYTNCPFTTMKNSFRNCINLDYFNAQNFLSAKNFDNAWSGCEALSEFPAISCSNAVSFISTWAGCTTLNNFSFYNDTFANMQSGNDCFNGAALSNTTWSNILIALSSTNTNTNVRFHGGNSKRNITGTAAYTLLTSRGWIITDGGQAPYTIYVSYE